MPDNDKEAMINVARAHAAAEGALDIEATMATLDDSPVYELQPMGRILRGRDFARHYYEHFFANCVPRITGYKMRSEWIADEGALQEYTLHIEADGIGTRHDIIGILTFGADGKLSGERIYASDELIQFMFGPFLDTATPA
ncbi:MAG: nuclear transport factor 2 family protein [Actinomycetota bacterium]|nr:nuclear transport factor 2 family protein [Actinomycetota bacterium]